MTGSAYKNVNIYLFKKKIVIILNYLLAFSTYTNKNTQYLHYRLFFVQFIVENKKKTLRYN